MFYKVLGGIFLMDLVRNFFFSFFMGFGFLLKSRVIVKLHFLFVALLRFWDEFFRTKNGYWKMFCQ